MMLALVGLHSSGKSYLAAQIQTQLNWSICVKHNLLLQLHQRLRVRRDFVEWYRERYRVDGSYSVARSFLQFLPQADNLVLDSVHSLAEWRAVREVRNDAILAIVIAPEAERRRRGLSQDVGLDIRRIRYWHDDETLHERSCLAAESQWCFNGAGNYEVQRCEIMDFLMYFSTRKLGGSL